MKKEGSFLSLLPYPQEWKRGSVRRASGRRGGRSLISLGLPWRRKKWKEGGEKRGKGGKKRNLLASANYVCEKKELEGGR